MTIEKLDKLKKHVVHLCTFCSAFMSLNMSCRMLRLWNRLEGKAYLNSNECGKLGYNENVAGTAIETLLNKLPSLTNFQLRVQSFGYFASFSEMTMQSGKQYVLITWGTLVQGGCLPIAVFLTASSSCPHSYFRYFYCYS